MHRIRFLILVMVLSIAILGTGFAYWSEAITVSSTVSTGELSVELLSYDQMVDVGPPHVYYNGMQIDYPASRLAPFDVSSDKHTLTARFKDMFPGMFYNVPFSMKNNGTIPAVLKRCNIVYDIDDACLNGENESDLVDQLENNLIISHLEMNIYTKNNGLKNTIPFIDGFSPVKLADLESKINNTLAINKIQLEPGEWIQLSSNGQSMGGYISFLFSGGFDNRFQNKQFSVDINLDWRQFNEID